ncbi:MAG: hypothetical protein BWY47_01435 [Bacteroidetes bacterium ADurb.Bin302]|nr:MAG: hypothetical protein BWY47_01435 [Bacteroidetes bacterium ADurb.Bin302]
MVILLKLFPVSVKPETIIFPSDDRQILVGASSPDEVPLKKFSHATVPLELIFIVTKFLFPF